jgi:hypothetical protein
MRMMANLLLLLPIIVDLHSSKQMILNTNTKVLDQESEDFTGGGPQKDVLVILNTLKLWLEVATLFT